MIGKLTGIVDSVSEDHAILDVNGVGYLVQCPSSTLSKLSPGGHISLMIETKVSEDAIRLYGFHTSEEREWFRLLQTVQNVGARVALNVLSALSSRELERALALSDKAAIGKAQGVGPKLALRITTELKDKAPAMILRGHDGEGVVVAMPPRGPEADAVAALIKLGYSQGQAAEMVARAANDLGAGSPVDALIRESLRAVGR
ncbi:MAG: Holliday junction branch migration protein RuvA [Alphaproteobacteria bacterium]|nr:Holliday junction branch migration protein RuvA [Alphaproteobacteria bacterium]MBV9904722.1 Holliday junction branch migration protein RuvA [Alphaproteobacteria bacterium]